MKNFKNILYSYKQSKILHTSFIVAILTAVLFFGFFLRDYYIAKFFGFSRESDRFYLVSTIPMFLVGIFCIPFGQVIMPFFDKIKKPQFSLAISYFFSISIVFCLILCFIAYALYDVLYLFKGHPFQLSDKLALLAFLPLLLLSGWLILCNSILLHQKHYLLPNIAQLIVPLLAICFLFFFASSIGVYSVILGMVLGQFFNLMIIKSALKKEKIFFRGFIFQPPDDLKKVFWTGYIYLVIIAIFNSVNIPLSTFIASSLGGGAVSIFNLGIKFNLFFCGLFTVVFSSVFLPYFSKIFNSSGAIDLHRETLFLLFFTSVFLIPFSALAFFFSDDLTFLIFHQIIKENSSILALSSVIKYSLIQLPFWVFNIIILKHGNVMNRMELIALVSIIISVLNLIFSLFFIKFMNVGGLSFSMALSTGIGSFLLLLYCLKQRYLNFLHGVTILLVWCSFIGLTIILNQEKFLAFLKKFLASYD